jgi:SagB-type dehydrogenase family enzyme
MSKIGDYLARIRRELDRQAQPPGRPAGAPLLGRGGFIVSSLAAMGGFALGWLVPSPPSTSPPPPAAPPPPPATADFGVLYHRWSKPGYSQAMGTLPNWGQQPEQYKTYPGAGVKRVALPAPRPYRGLSLEEAVDARRSRRTYSGQPLSLADLSRLLHAAQGITQRQGELRAAPSAGALYPIELYAVAHNVAGLEPGIYHYAVPAHELELMQPGDQRAAVTQAGLGQGHLGQANVCFVLSAIFQRARWKYHERTYRYALLEAGHIGQNLYLAATSLGLGACAVGAFLDDDLNRLLGLDGEEEAALLVITGGTV